MLHTFVDELMPRAERACSESPGPTDREVETAWRVILGASRHAWGDSPKPAQPPAHQAFALDAEGRFYPVSSDRPPAVVACGLETGWQSLALADDPVRAFLDLYLPLCGAGTTRPVVVGHLGQSLDGFIATREGESQWITGHENLIHMHRLRAICDAVVVGAGTVAADDPQLTTRLVVGPNPVRVVLDPSRRLMSHYRVFADAGAPTLYMCAESLVRPGEKRWGHAEVVAVEGTPEGLDPAAVLALLRQRGCGSVFVEGGGVTVSSFLAAGLLDRLHIAVAPLIMGEGRRAIRLAAPATLDACNRPSTRVFRMGSDVLFDCDLRGVGSAATAAEEARARTAQFIARVY